MSGKFFRSQLEVTRYGKIFLVHVTTIRPSMHSHPYSTLLAFLSRPQLIKMLLLYCFAQTRAPNYRKVMVPNLIG